MHAQYLVKCIYLNFSSETSFFFLIFKDKNEEGRIAFDELKAVLTKYGEQLDEDDADLILKQFNAGEGKILVEGINQHGSNIQFL